MNNQEIVKRMQYIREVVQLAAPTHGVTTTGVLSESDVTELHHSIGEMREQSVVRETPFTSQLPVLGRLIVTLRYAWNWMSTKWYVLPLVRQQNSFNALVARAWSTLEIHLNVMWGFTQRTAEQLASLAERVELLDTFVKAQATREPSVITPTCTEDSMMQIKGAEWANCLNRGPVVVFAEGQETVLAHFSAYPIQFYQQSTQSVSGIADPVRIKECLTQVSDDILGGALVIWRSSVPLSMMGLLLGQLHRVLCGGAVGIWVWPWSALTDDSNARLAQALALGLGFRETQLSVVQDIHTTFHTLVFKK